jgi:hypothetical protein
MLLWLALMLWIQERYVNGASMMRFTYLLTATVNHVCHRLRNSGADMF